MAKREAFLMRVDPEVLDAVRRWARDDLRSVNAQVEFILRRALLREGRLRKPGSRDDDDSSRPPANRRCHSGHPASRYRMGSRAQPQWYRGERQPDRCESR